MGRCVKKLNMPIPFATGYIELFRHLLDTEKLSPKRALKFVDFHWSHRKNIRMDNYMFVHTGLKQSLYNTSMEHCMNDGGEEQNVQTG